ncbi:MAG: hypothetical protein J0I48_10625 [Devosia sp.]|uniref:hypothetical protein n=1 Tax=Devosia sp. 66-22 TaxID=1895753 RepID=UPI000925B98A|nr:hypothetical protein [Devosia sp. 66-22]MBN9346635.1 hypothetical protein [Devosia sp.]OJX54708.1 MAG: hypothetical protein BGO81_16440 [Devosia sp. 66-22]
MTDKKKPPKITGPRMVFKFPKLNEPDYGSKDYPKPDGEYSTRGVMTADDAATKEFIKQLQPLYDEALAEAEVAFKELKVETRKKLGGVKPNDLFTTLYDQETEEPTGEIEFKFAMKASGVRKKGPKAGTKWTMKPDIYDASGKLLVKAPSIWGGTVGKISFEASPYFIPGTGAAGLKLSLLGVQIIDLKSAGQRSAASHGFGAEDGYTHTETVEDEDEGGFGDETGGDASADAGSASGDQQEF